MGLASHIAKTVQVPLPLGEAAESIYSEVVKEYPELAKKDFSSVFVFLKEAAQKGKQVTRLASRDGRT
jgi:3-hydroxyisobutyrate dehydrogenase